MGHVNKGFFVASTGQHVGKTTTCLGLLAGLRKRFECVGFIKPVGQEQMETRCGHLVDKDVILFKEHFDLKDGYESMSPVLLPQGFTRDFIDGKISDEKLREPILAAFQKIHTSNNFTLVEGTGHVSVGSIVNMNNAQVAALLGLPMILVAPGGVGSSFDLLAQNRAVCEMHGVKIAGVILNRIRPEKLTMIRDYMSRALARWNIPLLGCIPFAPSLANPSMKDFELLFGVNLLSGEDFHMRHFKHTRLVAGSMETACEIIEQNELLITPATREDIIRATLEKQQEAKTDIEAGMILTGDIPPDKKLVEEIKRANIPMLYTKEATYDAMQMIASFTAKIRNEDTEKVKEAIQLVDAHVDFDRLLLSLS